jgi:hypothetical protein
MYLFLVGEFSPSPSLTVGEFSPSLSLTSASSFAIYSTFIVDLKIE